MLLLVVGLGVPVLASVGSLAIVIGLLLLASLGLGLLIAVVSDSERQAVAAVPADPPRLGLLSAASSWPSTSSATRSAPSPTCYPSRTASSCCRTSCSAGSTNHLWQVGALIAIATVTLVAAWLLLRRNMRTA
jgi:hypothetical protein